MAGLHPLIEPYDSGFLGVGDADVLYWEQSGTAAGVPALVLHGGPGSGIDRSLNRLLDPSVFRVVAFDQRGCGRSTPHASDPLTTLASNTTRQLVEDIERLRRHLGIDRWIVFGVSWGSTLALVYSETYPDRVKSIVLGAVTTTRPSEIDWLYHGVGVLLPGPWEEFQRGSGIADPDADLVAAYRRLLEDPDPEVRHRAALNWCRWEDAVVSGGTPATPNPRYDDPEFRMAFARIVTHYFAHHAWLSDGQLIANAPTLDGIPGVLVHGSSDFSAQSTTAEELAAAWSTSELHLIEDAGHSSANPLMSNVLIEAFDNLGQTVRPDRP